MKLPILILIILLFTSSIFPQPECDLTIESAPKLIDLKLRMTSAEVNSVLGRDLKVKAKKEGQSSVFKNYLKKDEKGKLKGIRALFLRFNADVLYQVEIFYKSEFKWQTLPDFVNNYSSQNNFPLEFWKTEYGYSKARCKGFSLDADYILNPHIQLTDDVIVERVAKYLAEKATTK